MKQQIGKCFFCAGLTMALAITFLIGCGRAEEIDYSIEGIKKENRTEELPQTEDQPREENSAGRSEVSQFADGEIWSDSWTIEGELTGVVMTEQVNVEAQVLLPDMEEMRVVEVTVPEFDAAFKERVVKTLFENGDVYYNDEEHLPRKELEALYRDYKQSFEGATAETSEYLKQSMEKYEKLLETAVDTYTVADSYEVNEYIGETGGITYELYFSEAYGEEVANWYMNTQYINFYASNFEEICPEEYKDYTRYMEHPYMTVDRYTKVGENACKVSLEEAEMQARTLLEELGLEYPVLTYTRPLIWGDETLSSTNIYDWPANGYAFTFEYGVDDISFTGFGENYEYDKGADRYTVEEQVPYSLSAFANVYVTDKGIVQLYVHCPVETVGMSEGVELLPFDTIQEIMQDELQKRYEEIFYTYVPENEYTHMELVYFRVRDRENVRHYSYVPAWRLSNQLGDVMIGNRQIRNSMILNAIDGSWIDVGDEIGPLYFSHIISE